MTIFDLSHISLTRKGARILDDVSLTVRAGEHWALLGPNGCGKTTLLNILTGYLWPMEGTVTVLGDRYGTVDIREKRRHIGLVSSALFERVPSGETFTDVVLSGRYASLGLYEEIHANDLDRAREIVTFLSCGHIADRPYGVLSFGERQRSLIGRALMADPSLLILDEPCEGLDISAREMLLRTLDSLAESGDMSLLMVTHRVEEIPPAVTHAAIMKGGCMVASGKKPDTITSENISKAMGLDVEILSRNGRLFAITG